MGDRLLQPAWMRAALHPLIRSLLCLAGCTVFAVFVLWQFEGQQERFYLYYFLPVGAPFITFVLERVEYGPVHGLPAALLDGAVVTLALLRAFTTIGGYSGHSLFLSYALLTARSRLTRVLAAAVLLQVAVLKVFVWRDATLFSGMAAAALAGLVYASLMKGRQHNASHSS